MKREVAVVEEAAIAAEEHATATTVISALSEAKKHSIYRTEEGRMAHQSILTAAVGPSKQSEAGGVHSGTISI